MAITLKYTVLNPCYTIGKKIAALYGVVHSTGCGYEDKDQLWNSWNNTKAKKGASGIIDDTGSYTTLPIGRDSVCMGWQVGPDGNGISFGAEIAEPRNIAYTTPAHTTVDTTKYNPKDPAIIADFELRWKFAVEWWANAMKVTGLQIDHLLSHSEMHKLGMATNHGDPEHWFRCFGRTMDMFRADVQVALDKLNKPTVPIYKVVKVTPPDTLNVRAAATANSAILDTLKDGTVVELVGDSQDGKWSQLRRTGAPGWVRNSFLEELPKTYTVVKGDRLGALAKRFGVTLDDLAEANNIQSPQYLIRIGQVLTIPRGE